jgi:hypothetical protein
MAPILKNDIISSRPNTPEHCNNYLHEERLVNQRTEERDCIKEIWLNQLSQPEHVPVGNRKGAIQKKVPQGFFLIKKAQNTVVAQKVHIPSS